MPPSRSVLSALALSARFAAGRRSANARSPSPSTRASAPARTRAPARRRPPARRLRAALPLALALTACSCSTTSYLFQAGKGQLALINHARPIPEVLKDETVPPRTRALLEIIPEVKSFAEKHGLKATTNYTEYVALDRPYVVWSVSACAPLEFKPKTWSFPIVGSFPYLGWFTKAGAEKFAAGLRAEDLDVDVRGVSAFSTLGWFRDAVLSSMIPAGDGAYGDLVDVVIHESTHATLYISDQTFFNESLAVFVAEKLAPVYIAERKGADSAELKAYRADIDWYGKVQKRLHQAYEELDAIYKGSSTRAEKLARKERVLAKVKDELQWRRADLNNATLMQFRTYNDGRAMFEEFFARKCESDLRRFLSSLGRIPEGKWSGLFARPQQEDFREVLGKVDCG